MKKLITVCLVCAVIFGLVACVNAQPTEGSFFIRFVDGWIDEGGSSGTEWYYYDNTGWWNAWFDNQLLDFNRWAEVSVDGTILTTGAPQQVTIAINFTGESGGPPIPPLTPEEEVSMIERWIIFDDILPADIITSFSGGIQIPYNPRWLSIDVMNVSGIGSTEINGTIQYECVPEPATICLLTLGGLGILRKKSV